MQYLLNAIAINSWGWESKKSNYQFQLLNTKKLKNESSRKKKKKKVVCGVGVIAPGGVLHPIIDRFLYYYYCAFINYLDPKKKCIL